MLKKTVSLLTVALGLSLAAPAMADTAAMPASKGRVLLVATSADILKFKDGRTHRTGYFLGELTEPAQELIKAGYEVVVSTPDGNTPPLDKNSINPEIFGNSEEKMNQAMRFAEVFILHQIHHRAVTAGDIQRIEAVKIADGICQFGRFLHRWMR